jgi:hypothetical protein
VVVAAGAVVVGGVLGVVVRLSWIGPYLTSPSSSSTKPSPSASWAMVGGMASRSSGKPWMCWAWTWPDSIPSAVMNTFSVWAFSSSSRIAWPSTPELLRAVKSVA